VDRGKNGCKRHLICDRTSLPLLVRTSAANLRDEAPLLEMLQDLPAIHQPRGRPRQKPKALYGDRGYGYPKIIAAVKARGIESKLAPRGTPHGSGLGKVRYVVERGLAWFGHCRRIKLCYEKCGEHFQAFHDLAASLLCFKRLQQVTGGL